MRTLGSGSGFDRRRRAGYPPSKDFLSDALIVARAPTKKDGGATGAGGMDKFTTMKGVAAPMELQNIDTDMIIPKQFLKTIKRTGLGVSAFYEMRYDEQGNERPDFVLNRAVLTSSILVAGNNFGCGSSREHAPWAINDFGIKCIISTAFADIFFNNCFKNAMLPIVLDEPTVNALMADANAEQELEIDLPNQVIIRANGEKIPFEVDAFRKHCLINGLDDIGLTMQQGADISSFEAALRSLPVAQRRRLRRRPVSGSLRRRTALSHRPTDRPFLDSSSLVPTARTHLLPSYDFSFGLSSPARRPLGV